MPRLIASMFALCLSLSLLNVQSVMALDSAQASSLKKAGGQINTAVSNFNLASKSVGTRRPVTGSRLKLAMVRLKSVESSLAQAAKILTSLPADDKNVKSALDAHANLVKQVADFKASLTAAPPAQQPAAPTTRPAQPKQPTKTANQTATSRPPVTRPARPAPAPPLPRSQAGLLSEVDLILRMADVALDNLEPAVDNLMRDPNAAGSLVQNVGGRIMQTNGKLKKAQAILQKLPGNHPKVASVITRWQNEQNRTSTLAKKLLPKWEAVQKAGGKSSYPDYDKDLAKLQDFSNTYRDHQMDLGYPEKMAAVFKNDKLVHQELSRINTTYKPMIDQQTQEGNKIAGYLRGTIQKRNTYLNAAKQYHPQLIERIKKELASLKDLRERAIKEKKPLFLTGGVEQYMRQSGQWIDVLHGYAPSQSAPYTAQLEAERKAVAAARISLRESIIENNTLPSDKYTGKDKAELIDLATQAWLKVEPGAKILTARIPSQAWKRETRWEGEADGDAKIQGGKIKVDVKMNKYDNSKIQIQLIVADKDAKLAIIRPVNLWKNHMAGDTITAYPFYSLKDKPQPHAYLLKAKVK